VQLKSWGPFLESPEKPFVKLGPAYSVKLVFSYVVKGIKITITAKFRDSWRLSFEDTKRIMSPEMRPKSFGTFEKQAPGLIFQQGGEDEWKEACLSPYVFQFMKPWRWRSKKVHPFIQWINLSIYRMDSAIQKINCYLLHKQWCFILFSTTEKNQTWDS